MSWDRPERELDRTPQKPYCHTLPPPLEPPHLNEATVRAYLSRRGLDADLALAHGWYASTHAGDHALRVVIPAFTLDPDNRFWQARAVDDADVPRYQSPAGCRAGAAVVRINPSGPPKGTALVEGPFDALAAAEVGWRGVAWMGKAPTEDAIALARTLCSRTAIVVVADRDALRDATRVWQRFPGAHLVDPYPHKDLAEMPPNHREALLWFLGLGT